MTIVYLRLSNSGQSFPSWGVCLPGSPSCSPSPQPAMAQYKCVIPTRDPWVPCALRTDIVHGSSQGNGDWMNALCRLLLKAVTLRMDPSSTQPYMLEDFQEAGVWCSEILPKLRHPDAAHKKKVWSNQDQDNLSNLNFEKWLQITKIRYKV